MGGAGNRCGESEVGGAGNLVRGEIQGVTRRRGGRGEGRR